MPLFFPVRGSSGKEEQLHCLADVPVRGPELEELCVAYKTSSYAVLVPLYLKDDGYVLAVKSRNEYYPMPVGAALAEAQRTGQLPTPLPAYSIPISEYAFGYSVWIVFGVMLGAAVWRSVVTRHRFAQLNQLPVGPLELRTETDRWLAGEAKKVAEEGEFTEYQAYGFDALDSNQATRAYFVVVTNRRLLVIRSRLGGFAPKRENLGLTAYARSSLIHVEQDQLNVAFYFDDQTSFQFYVAWSERHLSNQRRFLLALTHLMAEVSYRRPEPQE